MKCQVTVSMPRQSISSHRFEWECLLSLRVWAVDSHQRSVSGLPCSQFTRVTVLKFGLQDENFISKCVSLSDVQPTTDFHWPENLTGNLRSVFVCLCECISLCVGKWVSYCCSDEEKQCFNRRLIPITELTGFITVKRREPGGRPRPDGS